MIDDSLIPFHQQAEEHGIYVLSERARETDETRPDERHDGPSENTD